MAPATRRTVLILGAASLAAACAGGRAASYPAGMRLIALRHADRSGDDLNEAGRARAAALPAALSDQKIDAILSPGIQRNLDTAAPLAAATGLTITRIPAETAAKGIAAQGDRTVVWVGNKDNLTDIWSAFALPGDPPLDYGQIFVVTQGGRGFSVEQRQFGPPV
ncbi:histidine phosphatase family protein [Anianabacter salinae]|uniref:histidine phosphatase family protein n=1 Tax=Anianabacter salinae TaxID=2851023 RepID=UPI00225E5845|nr:histidine phosphatase family protein [Anianabacter salinae]MBV0911000.1 histidine phosphatase family protein [Anianabacter salinae]